MTNAMLEAKLAPHASLAGLVRSASAASARSSRRVSGLRSRRRLLKPLADSWPSYSGDYSGRRYSALTQINQSNVKQSDAGVGRDG